MVCQELMNVNQEARKWMDMDKEGDGTGIVGVGSNRPVQRSPLTALLQPT